MKLLGLTIVFSVLSLYSSGQIDLNDVADKQKKEKVKKEASLKSTAIYLGANWSYCFRSLEVNEGLFGEPLGDRENEKYLSTFSYSIGLQNQINNFLFWDGGISLAVNGEQLTTTMNDTTTNRKTQYRYLMMPLRINAFYENKVRISGGLGVAPQLFLNSKEFVEITNNTTENSSTSESKNKNGFNAFAVSAIFNAGLSVPLSKSFSFWLSPEVRIQLNSSYAKTQPYIHKGRAFGLNFGFLMKL
ncbi:MAG: hypothetical protein V4638_04935 [Bacteroidota bacterium]